MTPREPAPARLDAVLTITLVLLGGAAALLQSRPGPWGRILLAGALALLLLRLGRNAFQAWAGRLPWGRLLLPGVLAIEGLPALAQVGPRGAVVKGATAAVLELGLLGLAWHAWRKGSDAEGSDPVERLPERRLARRLEAFLGPRAARMVAVVLVVLGGVVQALLGRGRVPIGEGFFSYHRESFLGSLLLALPIMAIGDLLLLDRLLRHAVPWVRWGVHAVDFYGLLWILGLWQSMRARPHRVDGEALWLHRGILGNLRIPREHLGNLQPVPTFDDPAARRAYLKGAANLAVSGGTEFLLDLAEPLRPLGFLGMGQPRQRVVFTVDDPEPFRQRLSR